MARPKAEIDWKKVAYMCEYGALGTEIAAALGVSAKTLYKLCKSEQGKEFSTFRAENLAKGDQMLKKVQYETAVKLQDKSMLVWLGKNRLGQKDKHDVTSNDETVKPSWTINVVDPNNPPKEQ